MQAATPPDHRVFAAPQLFGHDAAGEAGPDHLRQHPVVVRIPGALVPDGAGQVALCGEGADRLAHFSTARACASACTSRISLPSLPRSAALAASRSAYAIALRSWRSASSLVSRAVSNSRLTSSQPAM